MRIANTKNPRAGTLERRVPRARCRRDITCHTQTPAVPGARCHSDTGRLIRSPMPQCT